MIPALLAGGRAAIAVAPRLANIAMAGARSGGLASSVGANAVRGGMVADKVGRSVGTVGRMASPAFKGATAVASHPLTQVGMMAPLFLPMAVGQQQQAATEDMQAQGGYPQASQPQQLPATGANYQQPGANNVDPALDPEIRAKTMKRLREQNAVNEFYMQSLSQQPQQF